jgi:hypothetical protein
MASRAEWNAARTAGNGALSSVLEGDFNAIGTALNQARIRVQLAYTR